MRKLLIGCVVMAVIATVGVLFAHRAAESAPREDFVALEHQWLEAQAKGDAKTLGEMYGNEFLGVSYGPDLLTKTDILPFPGKPGSEWTSASLENVHSHERLDFATERELLVYLLEVLTDTLSNSPKENLPCP